MTDTTQGQSPAKKSTQIAKREWIDDKGEHTSDRTKACGARYTFLKTGKSIERIWQDANGNQLPAGLPVVMAANMGWMTKVGNVVNSVVNADDYNGTDDPMEDVEAWDKAFGEGVWREESEGVARGPKYDKGILAQAIVAEIQAQGQKPGGDAAYYEAKLADKSYYAKVRGRQVIMARYYNLLAAAGGQPAADATADLV